MLFLFELHILLTFADRAVLLHAVDMLLPSYTLLILFMKTHRPEPVSRLLTVHGEDCAFTSRHNKGRIRIYGLQSRKSLNFCLLNQYLQSI